MWLKRVFCVFEKSLLTISNWQQLTALQLKTHVQTKEELNRGRKGEKNIGGFVLFLADTYIQDRNKRKNSKKKKIEGEGKTDRQIRGTKEAGKKI